MNQNRNLRCRNDMLKIYYRKTPYFIITNLYHCRTTTIAHFLMNHLIVLKYRNVGVWWLIYLSYSFYRHTCECGERTRYQSMKFSPVIFPEFHICLTSDFDYPAGFHLSPALISTTAGPGTLLTAFDILNPRKL